MNIDRVIQVAQNSGLLVSGYLEELYLFANAIARIEREECAKIADEANLNAARIGSMHPDDSPSRDSMFARSIEAGYIADEIRSKA